jgi:PAS domain S-box-containing protein
MANTKNTLEVDDLRQMRSELDAARVRYADLYDFAPAAHLTLNQDGEILEANLKAGELLGVERARLLGRKLSPFVAAEARDTFHQLCRRAFDSAARQGAEFEMMTAPGRRLTVQVEAARDATNPQKQCRFNIVDITERREAEKTMRRSEERYRLLFASSRDAIMTLEPPARNFTSGNPACVEMFRTGDEQRFISAAPWELSPEFQPDGRPSSEAALAMIETALRRGSHFFEWRHRRLDGEEFPSTVLLTRVELEGHRFLQATVRDITDQKRAEARIAQLDRVKSFLAGVDRAIVRIPDQQKLLDAICRVAVEQGGFKLAWIGLVASDGSVKPVAMAGATEYLEGIRVVALDEPDGHGPVGEAIREKRPVVIEDAYQDARMDPWRQRARKFGLRYVAAFPFRMGNRVAGSFQAYARRPGFFDGNEIGLLTQVSDEISFALTAMADANARSKVEEQLRKHSQAVEQSPAAIVITDVTGAIEYVNPKFTELTGYTADEVRGKNPRLLKSGEMPAEVYQQLWQTITQGQVWHGELHNRKKNGELFWESASISPIKTADGKITHFVAIKEDITERKQVKKDLQEAVERFQLVTRVTKDAIWDWNLTRPAWWNDTFYEVYGFDRNIPPSVEAWASHIHPDDRERVLTRFRAAVEHGEAAWVDEFRFKRADGTYAYISDRAYGFRDASGKIVRMFGSMLDISQIKQAETALRRSQERYVLAERAVNDGLWDWNIQTDEDYFSPHWKEIIGYRDDELPNHKSSFLKNIHPDDRAVVDAATRAHLEQGERYAFEFRLRHKDGGYRWVFSRGEARRDATGRPVRMVGAITDITERKLAEKDLQEAAERFQLVSRATNDAIWDWNLTGPAWWNDAFYEVYDFDRSIPPSPEAWESGIHPDDRERVLARVRAAVEHGEPAWVDEFRFRRRDGTYGNVYHRTYGLRDASGKIVRMLGSMMDITERKQLEERIRAERERLESEVLRRIELEQERIGRDLHDGLCQSLVGAKYRIGVLEKLLSEKIVESADTEAKEIEQMLNRSIQQARDLAKGLNPVTLKARGLASSLEELAREVEATGSARCRCQLGSASSITDANVTNQLYRITQEAVHNAVKHGKAQGISITLRAEAGTLVFTVEDDGVGFPTHDKKLEGAGLYNMRTRAAMIGGTLAIRRGPHGGSVITVSWPATTKHNE